MFDKIYCEKESIIFMYKIAYCKSDKKCIKNIYIEYYLFIQNCINNKIYNS